MFIVNSNIKQHCCRCRYEERCSTVSDSLRRDAALEQYGATQKVSRFCRVDNGHTKSIVSIVVLFITVWQVILIRRKTGFIVRHILQRGSAKLLLVSDEQIAVRRYFLIKI